MQEPDEISITRWFHQLRGGDHAAAEMLWKHYFPRLVEVGRQRFSADRDIVHGADDVAQSVFHLLCNGAKDGRYEDVATRDDLWRLLVAATRRKVIDHVRARKTQKRGGGVSVVTYGDDLQTPQPTAETLVMMDERLQQLLDLLRDDVLRRIAVWRLEGYSNAEIAEKLSLSERTVERKLNLIRGDWQKELESD